MADSAKRPRSGGGRQANAPHALSFLQLGLRKEIDDLYINLRYYIVPDGELGQQARKLAAVL